MKRIIHKTISWMAVGIVLFLPTACTSDDAVESREEITLTTPVLQLEGTEAYTGSRLASRRFTSGTLHLDLLQSDQTTVHRSGEFKYANPAWTVSTPVSVSGGAGEYYAKMCLDATLYEETQTPSTILNGIYTYTGTIDVTSDGTFTPGDDLEIQTAAIMIKLKDANGEDLDFAVGYSLQLVGVPVYGGQTAAEYAYGNVAYGNYSQGTHGSDTSWPLLQVTANNVSWTVNYTGTLTLQAGKLYTFTVTLGGDSQVTLGSNSVTISDWTTGDQIIIGK